MTKRLGHTGVTLIELLVVMAIMTFVIAASSRLLTSMLFQFKQQTKIAESSIESLVGLEVLRRDLFSTGFGLPHAFGGPIAYNEASTSLSPARFFNDATGGVPRALIANMPSGSINGSYYTVIKSLMVADNSTAGKFSFLFSDDTANTWSPKSTGLINDTGERIVVYYFDDSNDYTLAVDSSGGPNEWRPGGVGSGKGTFTLSNVAKYVPSDQYNTRLIYGVNAAADDLRFPFNRADYYITNGTAPYASGTVIPERCAPGTGVLVKAVLNNDYYDSKGGGTFDSNNDGKLDEMPLLDCVADIQVGVLLDMNDDGVGDTWANAESLDDKSAADIRTNLKEIKVYILAQEGQLNPDYDYPNPSVEVGDGSTIGRSDDLSTLIGPNWNHYRWKVYTLVVQPASLNTVISSG